MASTTSVLDGAATPRLGPHVDRLTASWLSCDAPRGKVVIPPPQAAVISTTKRLSKSVTCAAVRPARHGLFSAFNHASRTDEEKGPVRTPAPLPASSTSYPPGILYLQLHDRPRPRPRTPRQRQAPNLQAAHRSPVDVVAALPDDACSNRLRLPRSTTSHPGPLAPAPAPRARRHILLPSACISACCIFFACIFLLAYSARVKLAKAALQKHQSSKDPLPAVTCLCFAPAQNYIRPDTNLQPTASQPTRHKSTQALLPPGTY
ncbi:hypothetical protein NHJ13051_009340 [Beauveria bassiana]